MEGYQGLAPASVLCQLRRILGIYWPEKIPNEYLLKRCSETLIDQQVKRRKWNLISHTLRRDSGHIAKQALEWNPQGKMWLAQTDLATYCCRRGEEGRKDVKGIKT